MPLLLAGCGQDTNQDSAKPASPPPVASTPGARSGTPTGDGDLLQGVAIGHSVTNAALAAGDRAWRELLKSMEPPSIPDDWHVNEPTAAVMAAFERKQGELAAAAAGQAREFYTKYPEHEKASEAHEREFHFLTLASQLGQTNATARLDAMEEARLKDPNITPEERLQVRLSQLQRSFMAMAQDPSRTNTLASVEKTARALQKDFPKEPAVAEILLQLAEQWADAGHAGKATTLARQVSEAASDPDVQETARSLLAKLGRVGQPIDLKFKALDGRAVDLAALRGKVTLLDFWATWCGPCVAELPGVKSAYAKLKDKGFEIVGISLDTDRAALEKFVKDEKMPWPQYFEEGGESNKFADQFGITGIPTLWLVDKKGTLRELNAREDLTGKVERLLSE